MAGTMTGPVDPRLSQFRSLYDLCSGYPEGMGYYCEADGTLATHPPTWPIYGDFLYVRRFCNSLCWCEDLEDMEGVEVGQAPPGAVEESEGCSSETDLEGAVVANECAESAADPLRTDNIGCSAHEYGHPVELDCGVPTGANAMIDHYSDEPLQVREFLGISGVGPLYSGYQTVQTPKSFTYGKPNYPIEVRVVKALTKRPRSMYHLGSGSGRSV